MKKILYVMSSVILVMLFTNCAKMDDTYKDLLADGPIIYLGKIKPDSSYVCAGNKRAILSLYPNSDVRAEHVRVFWNNGKDSVDYELETNKRTEVLIENLNEASHIFTLYCYNGEGQKSLMTELSGNVYGDLYAKYLVTKRISEVINTGDLLTIHFSDFYTQDMLSTELTWQENGVEKIKEFPISKYNGENIIKLEGVTSKKLKYRTVYLPEKNAVDKFYTEFEEVDVPPAKLKVVDARAETEQSGYEISKAYDGKYDGTHFNAKWGAVPFPFHLSFYFDEYSKIPLKRIVYTPRADNNPDGRFDEFELWVSTLENPELHKVSNGSFKLPSGAPLSQQSILELDESIHNVKEVQFVIQKGSNGKIACGEMEFFSR